MVASSLQELEDKYKNIELRSIIEHALSILEEHEKYIIQHRYGLLDNKYKTIKEISQDINKTEQAVYYTEKRALSKLEKIFTFKLKLSDSLLSL